MTDHDSVVAQGSGGVEPVVGPGGRTAVPAALAAGGPVLRALGDRATHCALRYGASDPADPYAVLVALTAEALTTVANIVDGGDDGQRERDLADLADLAETGDAIAWYARTLPTPQTVTNDADSTNHTRFVAGPPT